MPERSALQRMLSIIQRLNLRSVLTKWWIWELLACCGSCICFFIVIAVLLAYDGRPQPEWPWNITINSIVSWFTTIMKACLLAAVTTSISQASWIHFRTQPHALIDMAVYDSASRGPLGSMYLLWNLKAR